jgi:hypothetical protein
MGVLARRPAFRDVALFLIFFDAGTLQGHTGFIYSVAFTCASPKFYPETK